MSSKEKIIAYMQFKERITRKFVHPFKFYVKNDYEEIKKRWTDNVCNLVWNDLHADACKSCFTTISMLNFGRLCPQCIYLRYVHSSLYNLCDFCEYGFRHGLCDNFSSLFYSFYNKMQDHETKLFILKEFQQYIINLQEQK